MLLPIQEELSHRLRNSLGSHTGPDGETMTERTTLDSYLKPSPESLLAAVKQLVAEGANLHNIDNSVNPNLNGSNALHAVAHRAADATTFALIDYLHEQGVNPEQLNQDDCTPLDTMAGNKPIYHYVVEKFGLQEKYPAGKKHPYTTHGLSDGYGDFFKEVRSVDLGDGIVAEMRPMGVRWLNVWVHDSTIEPYVTNDPFDLPEEPLGGEVSFRVNTHLSSGKSELTGVAGNVVYSILNNPGLPRMSKLSQSLSEREFNNAERYHQGERHPVINGDYIERWNVHPVHAQGDHPEKTLEAGLEHAKQHLLDMREWNRKRVNGEPGGEPKDCPLEKLQPRELVVQRPHPGPFSEQAAASKGQPRQQGV